MTGRGVDQVLPHAGDPELRERYAADARAYVRLAERAHGRLPRPAGFAWPWGDALRVLEAAAPDVRVINLETSITRSRGFAAGKAIHYRMSPGNVPCLAAVRPGACALANNHVLDFGRRGLRDTLDAVSGAGLRAAKRPGDVVVVSVHWGSNWGYGVGPDQVRFAHRLIGGGVDLIHGHSSHRPRPVEVFGGKLVLYGCGDCINDYEGIAGHERYRGDLRLLYFASLHPGTGTLAALQMAPVQARKLRLRRARQADARWLATAVERASSRFGSRVGLQPDGLLALRSGAS